MPTDPAPRAPGARLRPVHGWTMFSSMPSGGPVGLSPVARTTVTHALGAVAVVPI
ncbi:hypothetical protein ABZ638_25760 [Streptomyces sp. NPDC007107]|uniref:hypothetical protein n=1 Tax=Streptomyces sp. NPDC007107 TaxID=3156915 RepID=UPI0033FBA2B9